MTTPLKIGIACFATYGGSGVVASELGRQLALLGHQVHFVSKNIPFRLQNNGFCGNIFYHDVPTISYDVLPSGMYGMEMASRLIQLAEDEKLDIIHAHYAVPHAISAIIAKQVFRPRKLKIVTTLHGTDITLVGRAPSFFPLTKWAIEQSDAVTTVSNWLRDETYREFAVEKPIHVIHNFVDPNRFSPDRDRSHRQHFADDDEKIILHLSNFRPVKRIDDAVKVFARVNQEVPSKLLLIGDGPERERTMELARRLGVIDRVFFLGKQNAIENYYCIADLFLFPSEYESFGVAALEALSACVPVVATSGSGLSEVVEDGQTGYLRPVGDVDALAAATISILKDPALAAQMGARGRERAIRCFQPHAITERYLSIYRDVLDGKEPSPVLPCPRAEVR